MRQRRRLGRSVAISQGLYGCNGRQVVSRRQPLRLGLLHCRRRSLSSFHDEGAN